MSPEVKILTIFVVISLLLGVSGTVISLTNLRTLRTETIIPGKWMMKPSVQEVRGRAPLTPTPGKRLERLSLLRKGKLAAPGKERRVAEAKERIMEKLQEIVKEKREKEKRLRETLEKIGNVLKKQEETLDNLSQEIQDLKERVDKLEQ